MVAMGYKSFCSGERGFSILGIIISAGMASGLAVTLTGITKDQQVVQRRAETYFEISNLSYLVLRTLQDSDACTQTLGVGTPIVGNKRWTSIKNKDGWIVLDKSEKYGSGVVQIQSIAPKDINIQDKIGDMNLEITFKKLGTKPGSHNKIIKTFPLSIDVDDSGKLVRCRSNHSNIVTTAKERMCQMLDGIFDPTTENCDLKPLLLAGQKHICESMSGTFVKDPRKCNMDSFILTTVKSICKSMQGTFNDLTNKCLFSSYSSGQYHDGLSLLNEPYPVCRIGFGAAIAPGSKSYFSPSTFGTCFGTEVQKLFKLVKSKDDIKIRIVPWKSYWLQYDGNGTLERINFYRRPLIPYQDYRNQIYFVDNNPTKGLREMYRLVNVQVRIRYAPTDKWYTFTFAVGINYPTGTYQGNWKKAEQDLAEQGKELFFNFHWLEPWGN